MNKPSNYENVSLSEDFVPVNPGGHHMIIKQVKEQKSQSGKDMLVVAVDFAPNDVQPLYFSKLFESDTRADKKWPRAGKIYVVSTDANGQCSRNFKTFITSFEHSNNTQVQWIEGPAFVNQFANKRIGGVYGIVEEEYNGERKKRCLHRWFCDDAKAMDAKVPEERLMDGNKPARTAAATPAASGNVPDGFQTVNGEQIPF